MNVSLKPELEKFVQDQVRAGRFASPDEVLEAGLTRLMLDPSDEELDAEDLAAIEESEQQITRGEAMDWKEISAKLRRQYLGK
jgi:antitoxin ParD1/3/4